MSIFWDVDNDKNNCSTVAHRPLQLIFSAPRCHKKKILPPLCSPNRLATIMAWRVQNVCSIG